MDTTQIVVGTDGSGSSAAAVRWAAREARRRDAALRIVHAYDWNWPGARFGGDVELRRAADELAETTVATAVTQAREVAPDVVVHRDAELGEAVPILLAAAKNATLLVVGSRGHGGFTSLLLGSVSQRVATHAGCPVTVVRGRGDIPSDSGPVVVGVDGSSSSLEALELGFRFAAERDANLVAVRAYSPPSPPWDKGIQPMAYDTKERDDAEHKALFEWLAPLREKFPAIDVEALVAHGGAAGVLTGVSKTAQIVVVGSRGHGSLAGTLIGSVGLQVLHHADCPVVIARPHA
jgi:nucleotide-binding universal stress UspA family protein